MNYLYITLKEWYIWIKKFNFYTSKSTKKFKNITKEKYPWRVWERVTSVNI